MKIVVFSDEGKHVVNTEDGTLWWNMMNSDGSASQKPVEMYVYRELSVHKFAYIAKFRDVSSAEINEAVIKYGYSV
ncbi:hypothetical protein DN602_08165 [Raoultella ornithinolytica]|nr:hypothetical protein DN602_08165 [Raoultella ornithinolytica]